MSAGPTPSMVQVPPPSPALCPDGLIRGEPADTYHATRAIGSHRLADFAKDPGTLVKWIEGTQDNAKEKDWYLQGRAIHCRALEGDGAYQRLFAPDTGGAKLKPAQRDLIENIGTSVQGHPVVQQLMVGGEAEVVARWRDWATGIPLQARFDWIRTAVDNGFDLKTVAYMGRFKQDMVKYGYHHQAAFYQEGYQAVTDRPLKSYPMVAVDKSKKFDYEMGLPHKVAIFPIRQQDLEHAKIQNRIRLDNMARFLDANGYNLEMLKRV